MAEPVVLPAFLAEAMFLKLHLLMDIFHAMDVNQDGVLSAEEFIAGMKKRNLTAQQLLALIDANGDGQIELAELLERRHSLSGHASFDTPEPQESVLLQLKHYALGLLWQAPPSPAALSRARAGTRTAGNTYRAAPRTDGTSALEREISERRRGCTTTSRRWRRPARRRR